MVPWKVTSIWNYYCVIIYYNIINIENAISPQPEGVTEWLNNENLIEKYVLSNEQRVICKNMLCWKVTALKPFSICVFPSITAVFKEN